METKIRMIFSGMLFCLLAAGSVFAGTIAYTYDDAGRLTKADYGSGTAVAYAYDAAGNLLSRAVTTNPSGLPVPDIKVNGSDGSVTLSQGSSVSVTIALDPGESEGCNADWWVAAHTSFLPPNDWFSYVYPAGWKSGIHLYTQTPLFPHASFDFAVDVPKGIIEATCLDSVELEIQ